MTHDAKSLDITVQFDLLIDALHEVESLIESQPINRDAVIAVLDDLIHHLDGKP